MCPGSVLWSLGQTGAGARGKIPCRAQPSRGAGLSIILRWPVLCFCAFFVGMSHLVDPAWIAAFSLLLLAFGTAYLGLKT